MMRAKLFVWIIAFAVTSGSVFGQEGSNRLPTEKEIQEKKHIVEYRNENWEPLGGAHQHVVQTRHFEKNANWGYDNGLRAVTNDVCASAVVANVSGCTTGQTTATAGADYTSGCATGDAGAWYEITLTGSNNHFDLSFANETMGGNVELLLFQGPCVSPTLMDVQCGDPATDTFTFDNPYLTPGTTYYLQVSNATGDEGGFDLCITEDEDPPGVLTGPEQDCSGAIPICSPTYTEINSYTGSGSTQEVSTSTCMAGGENNSVWYTFTIQDVSGGTDFGFTINATADYDFALYDITSGGCASIPSNTTPVRCNFSATVANTGLDETSITAGDLAHDFTQTPIMDGINVALGETYALVVDNWSGNNAGYSIDFSGNAKIFDSDAPNLSLITDCNTNTMYVTMDEDITCASIAAGEFTLTNTATTTDYTGNITSVSGVNCGTQTNQIAIVHDGTIPSGPYELEVVLGDLEDLCGNKISVGQKLTFNHLADVTIVPSVTQICDPGDAVSLAVTGEPAAGATYAWSPGTATTDPNNVNPTATTNYTVSVTYGGCTKTDDQTITLIDNVITTIDPIDPTLCSGTTPLTASTTVNGTACVGCTYDWGPGTPTGDGTATITANPGTTYDVTTTYSGCTGDNVPTSTPVLASAGGGTSCDVLYVSPAGGGDGLTKGNPTTLAAALTAALCSNTVIKMQTGTYNFTDKLDINSFVTVEGGYNSTFTTKTSDMTSGNCTRLVRSTAADSDDATECTMFDVAASADDWRLQDLRIEMGDNSGSSGVSQYGVKIGSAGSTGYSITRCYIDAGTASDGGTLTGQTIWSEDFESCGTGIMSDGGSFCSWSQQSITGSVNDWGIGGTCPITGSRSLNITNGTTHCTYNGGDNCDKRVYSPNINTTGYTNITVDYDWVSVGEDFFGPVDYGVALYSVNGGTTIAPTNGGYVAHYLQGTTQSVTNATLGVDAENVTTLQMGFAWVNDGSVANTPGFVIDNVVIKGDQAVAGETTYGIYSASSTTGLIQDCEIVTTASTNGVACDVCHPADASYTSVAITGYDVITMENISCRDTDVDFTKPGSSGDWTSFGTNATPATSTNTTETVQYSGGSLGRRSVTVASSCPGAQTFSSNPGTAITRTNCGAAATDAINVTGYSGTCLIDPANISVTINVSHTFDGDLEIALTAPSGELLELTSDNGGAGDNFTNTVFTDNAGTAVTAGTAPFTGSFRPEGGSGGCGAETETSFSTINGGANYNPNGNWTLLVRDDANGDNGTWNSWSISFPSPAGGGGGTYTDFVNMYMDKPSAGTVIGTNTYCPGDENNFGSSEAGTPGYTYAWTVTSPGGCGSCSSTIDSPTASNTDITLDHTEGTAQVITVTETITSECCGALTPVEFQVTVNPSPAGPGVNNATPSQCEGGSYTISVTPVTAGFSYDFYDAATGGTLLGSGVTYTVNPVPNGGDVIYVEAISSESCPSTSRTTVTLSETNTDPTVNGSSYCAAGWQTLSVNAGPAGTIYTWYDDAVGTTTLQQGTGLTYSLYVNCGAPCTQNVWVAATEPGCNQSALIQVGGSLTASAATTTWDGSTDDDWFDPTNWSDCVPSCGQSADFPAAGVTNEAVIRFADGIASGGDGIARTYLFQTAGTRTITFGDSKATLEVCQDFIMNGTSAIDMTDGSGTGQGTVAFTGTGIQNVRLGLNTTNVEFHDVIINNTRAPSAGPGVWLDNSPTSWKDLSIRNDGSIVFTDGVLYLESGAFLNVANTNTGSVGIGSTNSWVNTTDGQVRQYIASGESYNFPVGNADSYQLLTIDNMSNFSGGISYLDVDFSTVVNNTTGLPLAEGAANFTDLLNNGGTAPGTGSAGNMGLWTVSPDAGSADYDLSLTARNYDNQDVEQTVVKRPNGVGSWDFAGSTYGTTVINNPTSIYSNRTGFSGFSEFAMAKSAAVLPIELLHFAAICTEDGVYLKWETGAEINNDYMIVQKSKDGIDFIDICEIEGNGTTSEGNVYECYDSEKNGLYYYRLEQVDFDGKTKYSEIITENCGHGMVSPQVSIYPNPANENSDIFLELTGLNQPQILVVVNDILGKQHYSKVIVVEDSEYFVTVIDPHNRLSAGTYIITGTSDDRIFQKKLVVK